jgi:hypothetical protein
MRTIRVFLPSSRVQLIKVASFEEVEKIANSFENWEWV